LYAKHRKAKFAGKSSWAVIAGVGDQRCWVVVILTDLKICGGLSWIANTDWSNLKFVVVWQMTNDDSEITKISCKSANILYFYKILQLSKPFYSQKPSKNVYKNGAKSPTLMKISLFLILMYCLLYNCFKNCMIRSLRISVKKDSIFSVFLLITLFCILKYLNKEESKVIFMPEFEISLFQFSNWMFTDKRQFSFKNILKRFAKRLICGWILH
jgi:hypothetical protein